ncbi:hypothetical protein COLO4_36934 [Corchorus olitorius]|uniref:Uncharacterized protein n=1 Tax=Corchorus olitorius TaxID=93759 RepID=A0A1R3G444_9ROSI|nr:hypothetical protein COLO4_36934 [Corchorus olitorius]
MAATLFTKAHYLQNISSQVPLDSVTFDHAFKELSQLPHSTSAVL